MSYKQCMGVTNYYLFITNCKLDDAWIVSQKLAWNWLMLVWNHASVGNNYSAFFKNVF